ncbi:hypothetical protein N9V42_02030 [Flavobacteriaceae bacterium]|nr:hypothetical protein [Flavobacteriaceae bacterium]
MGRIIDKLKWLITTKDLKLIFVVRELLLLDYMVKKHIDYNDIRVREDQYLVFHLNALADGPEYKYLLRKYNTFTKKTFNSLRTFHQTMDMELLKLTSREIENKIKSIVDEIKEIKNEDISKNRIVIDYLNDSKNNFRELNIYY